MSIPLRKGVAFLYGPGTAHRITTDPFQPMEKFFVGFRGSGMRKFLTEFELESGSVLRISNISPLVRAFDEFINRGARDSHLTKNSPELKPSASISTTCRAP